MPEVEVQGSPRVLVVEDNPANMMLVTEVLKRAGYRTAQARSAHEARQQIAETPPDLILMDVQLPGEDGLSLTRELKRDRATSHIPVVALTAHAMKGDEALAADAGCDAYMPKPIDTRTFAAFVAQFLPERIGNG